MSDRNSIAIIGAGKAGKALLSVLLQIPLIKIKYISDIKTDAPALILAKRNDIEVIMGKNVGKILNDNEIDMIFEVTGSDEVFHYLQKNKHPDCNIMNHSMSKVIFFLLNSQQDVAKELRQYKLKLAERVIERTDELEKANYQLKEQIDLQQKLNEKLQQINNEKTKYLLNATHQLKAPFAAIQSYVDILIEGYADHISEKVLSVLEKIKVRCILLTGLIRKMLELANLNSAVEENISVQKENLADLIKKVIDDQASILEKHKLSIDFTHGGQEENINCNRELIETMIGILIENAINYSFDNGTIEITVEEDIKNRLIFSINDHGIGIEEKNFSRIFNEYFRSYNAAEKYKNGTGLGLPIAKRIAEFHQTEILVDSIPGKGATFIVPFRKI